MADTNSNAQTTAKSANILQKGIYNVSSTHKLSSGLEQLKIPQIHAHDFYGDAKSVTNSMVLVANNYINSMVDPVLTYSDHIQSLLNYSDSAVDTAMQALKVARVTSPKNVPKLDKALHEAADKVKFLKSFSKWLYNVTDTIHTMVRQFKTDMSNAAHHSIQWLEKRINKMLYKLYELVEHVKLWIAEKLKALEDKLAEKLEERVKNAEQKAQNKLNEKLAAKKAAKKEKSAKQSKDNAQIANIPKKPI